MNTRELQDEIIRLKKERDICVLAHSYQSHSITEVADFSGDSYQLSVKAKAVPQKTVVMCGVRFMAETVKILSPDKTVILANGSAGCPMAEQFDKAEIAKLRRAYPGYTVVAYINTTAELKTVCDVCVTSSSAVKTVRNIENNNIIFIPDINLGSYVAKCLPEKNIILLKGGCPVHASVTADDVTAARASHPGALLLVHPECSGEVTDKADFVGSTAAIIDFAKSSESGEFIIGTEISITEHLQFECPGKRFYNLSEKLVCNNMKLTTLCDLLGSLTPARTAGEEIVLPPETLKAAKKCIDNMLLYSAL